MLSLMPARQAGTPLLVAASAGRRPSNGCALRPERQILGARLGIAAFLFELGAGRVHAAKVSRTRYLLPAVARCDGAGAVQAVSRHRVCERGAAPYGLSGGL